MSMVFIIIIAIINNLLIIIYFSLFWSDSTKSLPV